MLVELRHHLDRDRIAPRGERAVFTALRRVLSSPAAFNLSAVVARALQRPFAKNGRLTALPFLLSRWTGARDLPVVAPRTFHERWKDLR